MSRIEIAALYHFARLPDFADLRAPLQALCDGHGLKGILLLASEGINGTIAGPPEALADGLTGIRALTGLAKLDWKFSYSDTMPFLRMKVRLKAEIVTIGDRSVDPLEAVGIHVEPKDWNALISDPDVTVIDARNIYEYRIGSFEGAIDPGTGSFSEFPQFVRDRLDPSSAKKIAMFCTGGIRCEKASAFMLSQGFKDVYQLKGGILKYLEDIEPRDSLWQGACFVFDDRVAVGQGLQPQDFSLCHGCREPLSRQDRMHADFEAGVSCAYCAALMSPRQKASARERQRQILLARTRGERHIGPRRSPIQERAATEPESA